MALSVKAISDSVKTISISESESSKSKYTFDKSKKTSEYWAERTINIRAAKLSSFDVSSENSLEEWLLSNKPSERFSENGDGYALIYDSVAEEKNDAQPDLDEALKIWQNLIDSKVGITHNIIEDIAVKYQILSGSWLCFVKGGAKVDKIWRSICTRYKNDKFNGYALAAQVSPVEPDNDDLPISIINKNYTDTAAVFALERILRQTGIKCNLCYKPDIFSHFRIYRNNEWNIRPTIFKSVYDIKAKESFITDTRKE